MIIVTATGGVVFGGQKTTFTASNPETMLATLPDSSST